MHDIHNIIFSVTLIDPEQYTRSKGYCEFCWST